MSRHCFGVAAFVSLVLLGGCRRAEKRGDLRVALRASPVWRGACSKKQANKMQPAVKGMIQVHSITYRIVRLRKGTYQVIRLLDDISVGTFTIAPWSQLHCEGDQPELVREIARAAMQGARTSWAPRRASSPTHEKVL